jgi:hypothetical protein
MTLALSDTFAKVLAALPHELGKGGARVLVTLVPCETTPAEEERARLREQISLLPGSPICVDEVPRDGFFALTVLTNGACVSQAKALGDFFRCALMNGISAIETLALPRELKHEKASYWTVDKAWRPSLPPSPPEHWAINRHKKP